MADYNLGTARGVIEIEYRGDAATQAQRDLRQTGSAAEDASRRTSRAGSQLAATGLVIAGGLAFAAKSAADFEARLSAVQAVSGASAEEMEQLREKSLQLGKDTAFSASESASAIEELVKAGLSVQDVMNGAADATVALAAAGEVSMPEAASIASNAMNQFGLAAQDLPKVADAIAGAANASAIDVGEFGMSLSQVGAVANLAGANFQDTATAIALMGNAGIKGSDAGTSLKSMLNNLQPTTEKATDLMQRLGLMTQDGTNKFYDQEGNLRSLADVSGLLSKSMEDLTKQQQQQALETIFGSDAIRAAAVLANQGADGFNNMADSMGKVTAADVAATRMDNLQGSIEQLKGSLETLMIVIGTPLLNGIRTVVDGLTSMLNIILDLPGPVLETGTMFLGLLSGLLILVGGFLKLRGAIMAMRAGLLLFTGPILLGVAAVAALVAAFVYFYKNSERFRQIVDGIVASVKDGLLRAFEAALPYIMQVGDFLKSSFEAALPVIKQLVDMFMNDVLPVIIEVGEKLLDTIVSNVMKVAEEIKKTIPVIKDLVASFLEVAAVIYEKVKPFLDILAQVFVGTILPLLIQVGGIFQRVFVTVVGNAIRMFIGIIRGMFNILSGVFKLITGILTGDWSKAWEGVKQIVRGAVGIIVSILRGLLSSAGAILKGLGQTLLAGIKAIPGLLKGAGGLFLAAGRFLIDQFVNGMKNAAGLIEGIASNVWNFVRGLLNGAIARINAALEFTIDPPGPGSVSVNPPDIPALASGGVVTSATLALIGEGRESEAVLPLSVLDDMLRRIHRAGQVSILDGHDSGRGGRTEPGVGRAGSSRLVEGVLSIDSSGRAYIRGVAEDVYEGNERFEASYRRLVGADR